MSFSIDREYISILASRLDQFQAKRNGVWNARCPFCGDSQKSKRKKRFYIYTRKGDHFVRCHNCGHSSKFRTFLDIYDGELYKEYILAIFNETGFGQNKKKKTEEQHLKDIQSQEYMKRMTVGVDYRTLLNFSHLQKDHPARVYVENRNLPFDRILYSPKFNDFLARIEIDEYLKQRFSHLDIPVIVIPFWLKKKHSRVFQIRTFDPAFTPKYLTFKCDEEDLKIFGRERINPQKPVYIVEGPFDAMGIRNGLAFSGMSSELPEEVKAMRKVFFLDNEPRNKDVVRQMNKIIKANEKVVILPDKYTQKDVNDFVKDGLDVETIFKQNTYQGAMARLKFNLWKKV